MEAEADRERKKVNTTLAAAFTGLTQIELHDGGVTRGGKRRGRTEAPPPYTNLLTQ